MDGVPVGLALAAGMLAVINPCGFALLPVYASLLVVGDDEPRTAAAVGRALALAGVMTAGFVAVFGGFGLLVAPAAGAVQRHLPWVSVVMGLALVTLGGWLAAGRALPGLRIAIARGPALTGSTRSVAMFGVAYALASLSCTIGPFLATVVASFRAGSVLGGIVVFAAYAAGMGLVVAIVSVAVALARTSLVTRLRQLGPRISRAGGVLLVVAGAYVAYYGWWEIRTLAGGVVDDPVIGAADTVRLWLASALDRIGPAGAAVIFALLVAGGLAAGRGRRTGERMRQR